MESEKTKSKPLKMESGVWEGQYLDVNGHRGTLRLTLEPKEDTLRGKYELKLITEDNPKVIQGNVEGQIEGTNIHMQLALGKTAQKVQYESHVCPAGSYAKQAIFGLVESVPQSNLGGGVWIAWKFAKSDRN